MALRALLRRNPALRRIVPFQLLAGLQLGTFTLLFNLYLLALGFREDLVGISAGAMTLGLSAAALFAGRVAKRWGFRRALAGGVLVSSLAGMAQALSEHAVFIVLFAGLAGSGNAMLQSLQMPLIAERVLPADRPQAAALASAVQSLSITCGTLIGGLLPAALSPLGWGSVGRDRAALLFAVALGALGAVPILGLDRANPGRRHEYAPSVNADLSTDTPRRVRRLVWRYAGATALISIGAGAFLPFVNVYLARLGASPGEIGGLLALSGALGASLGLLGPALARLLGQERLAVALRLSPVVPAALLLAIPTVPAVILTQATRQIGAGMTWPIEASILNERVPPPSRAGAFGLRIASWNLAWALSSTFSGVLIVRGGYNYPLLILIVSTALGALALSIVLRPTPEELRAREPAPSEAPNPG